VLFILSLESGSTENTKWIDQPKMSKRLSSTLSCLFKKEQHSKKLLKGSSSNKNNSKRNNNNNLSSKIDSLIKHHSSTQSKIPFNEKGNQANVQIQSGF